MNQIVKQIPERISDTEVLSILRSQNLQSKDINAVKEWTQLTDQILANTFNVSVKTFRAFKNPPTELKDNVKEKIILLISLFKHGKEVFGDTDRFFTWLSTENFYLDGGKPIDIMNTVTGIRFIDDRLTAMEYGDNV